MRNIETPQFNCRAGGSFQKKILLLVSLCIFVMCFGVVRATTTVPGVVPSQAPLQPIPQGVGPNISNNIVQKPETGVPDSASTIPKVPEPVGDSTETVSDTSGLHASMPGAPAQSSGLARYILIAAIVVCCLIGLGLYLWRQRSAETAS